MRNVAAAALLMVFGQACSGTTAETVTTIVPSASTGGLTTTTDLGTTTTEMSTTTLVAMADDGYLPVGALALRRQFPGGESRGAIVPDATLAVSDDRVLIVTNDFLRLFTDTGTPLADTSLRSFARASSTSAVGDPRLVFDHTSRRFFVVVQGFELNCPPDDCLSTLHLLVSKTESPGSLGSADWNSFDLDARLRLTSEGPHDKAHFPDYPALAVNGPYVVIGVQMERFSDERTEYQLIRVLDKEVLLAGGPVTSWRDFPLEKGAWGPGAFTQNLLPAKYSNPADAAAPFFLAGVVGEGTCDLVLFAISGPPGDPDLTVRTVELPGECERPVDAEQPGDAPAVLIDQAWISDRPVYQSGYLWVARVVAVAPPNDLRSAIKIVRLDVRDFPDQVDQVEEYFLEVPGAWLSYPALEVDDEGNLVVVFAQSSPDMYPSALYTGRLADDPPGELRPHAVLKRGEASQNQLDALGRNKYGDYFGAALDPDGSGVWVHGEYVLCHARWGTWVGFVGFEAATMELGVDSVGVGPPTDCGPSISGRVESQAIDVADVFVFAHGDAGGYGDANARINGEFILDLPADRYVISFYTHCGQPGFPCSSYPDEVFLGYYSEAGLVRSLAEATPITVIDREVAGLVVELP